MNQHSGARIGIKAFMQSFAILLALMIVTGVLTRVIPAGLYDRIETEERTIIDVSSFRLIERPDYPIWRWFTAP
ncbi:MAG: hypothetical protein MUC85_06330, partial [Anaerolineales bacterium]|nr:hypothetical protein [Anaerolineales bacterium]